MRTTTHELAGILQDVKQERHDAKNCVYYGSQWHTSICVWVCMCVNVYICMQTSVYDYMSFRKKIRECFVWGC